MFDLDAKFSPQSCFKGRSLKYETKILRVVNKMIKYDRASLGLFSKQTNKQTATKNEEITLHGSINW